MAPVDFERRHARERLTQAFVDGRIDRQDFDRRLGLVLQASNSSELGAALVGIRPVAQQPLPAVPVKNSGLAAFGHFSFFFLWIFGPLLTWAVAPVNSFARRESAKAFNFQFTSLLLGAGTIFVADLLNIGLLVPTAMLIWFVLTVVGGVKAAQGEEWTNPVMKMLPWNVLNPRGR